MQMRHHQKHHLFLNYLPYLQTLYYLLTLHFLLSLLNQMTHVYR
jgi:hypothetical protein